MEEKRTETECDKACCGPETGEHKEHRLSKPRTKDTARRAAQYENNVLHVKAYSTTLYMGLPVSISEFKRTLYIRLNVHAMNIKAQL